MNLTKKTQGGHMAKLTAYPNTAAIENSNNELRDLDHVQRGGISFLYAKIPKIRPITAKTIVMEYKVQWTPAVIHEHISPELSTVHFPQSLHERILVSIPNTPIILTIGANLFNM